jgi:hypothetical protein
MAGAAWHGHDDGYQLYRFQLLAMMLRTHRLGVARYLNFSLWV